MFRYQHLSFVSFFPKMWLRRVRDIQRTGFFETFSGANKRVSRAYIAIFNRLIIEGPSSDRIRTFLGTSSIESYGTRVSFRV